MKLTWNKLSEKQRMVLLLNCGYSVADAQYISNYKWDEIPETMQTNIKEEVMGYANEAN